MPPAARKTDLTVHGGFIAEGSPNVSIGFLPAARLLDKHVCPIHGPGPITQSSRTVFINGVGAARLGDKCTCMVPSKGVGGGSGPDKGEPVKFEIGPNEKKWGEKTKEWEKEETKPWKEKPPEPPTPKLTAELSKEFAKYGNADEKKGAFETGVWESKGTAKLGYEGDLANLKNAKGEATVQYEIEGSVAKTQGKLGDVEKGSFGEVGGEAQLITGHATAQGGLVAEMKNGKLEQAYVGGEAGIGVAAVEGKVEGKTRAFKIPFTNWGISFNGEVSGALLTAEAKASAMAGYKEGKWTFGFGAKVGAALAGLGFKFGFSIEKLDPPKPPPTPPGIPGFAGIDPIAKGCFTVLVGGDPPPYIPGPPRKEDYGGKVIAGPTNRNKAEALELKPSDQGRLPIAFPSIEVFVDFKRELNQLVSQIELGDAVLRMKDPPLDVRPHAPLDIDIGIESKALTQQMAAAGYSPHPEIPDIFKTRHVMQQLPRLQAFSQKWTRKLGRDVNFVGLVDPSNPPAAPTDYLL